MANNSKTTNICVFCASSANIPSSYIDVAHELGELIGAMGANCVCGGGNTGLMHAVSSSTTNSGGKSIGIIPRFMVESGWCAPDLDEVRITDDMHSRKQLMSEISDAIIALPGGCGTLEELLEVITWKQLGIATYPIIILNIDGFYNPLIEMLDKCVTQGFMKQSHSKLWSIASTPQEVIQLLQSYPYCTPIEVESKY